MLLQPLLGELRYYEQLSGRRSVFDAEELEVSSYLTIKSVYHHHYVA